jgi:hypothetical protein
MGSHRLAKLLCNGQDAVVTVYPVVSGFVLLGELDKWVTISPDMFSNLAIEENTLSR